MEKSRDEHGWYEDIYQKKQKILLRYSQKILKDKNLAQEAVQHCFLKLWEEDFEKIKPYIDAWLYRVCRNKTLDLLKNKTLEYEDNVIEFPTENKFDVETIKNHVSKENKELMRMKFEEGMSYKEIAEKLKISVSNVGIRIHREILTLRKKLKEENYE